MKTPFIPKLILLFILFFFYFAGYAQQRDSVTIRGQVTDLTDNPLTVVPSFGRALLLMTLNKPSLTKTDTTPPVFLKENIKVWGLSICLPTHIP